MKSVYLALFCMSLVSTLQIEGSDHSKIRQERTIAREKPQLALYYAPWCPYCQKVLNYLKQIHKSVPLRNVYHGINVKEELRRLGGKAQVPCLIIDGQPLYESSDIIHWLSLNRDVLDQN